MANVLIAWELGGGLGHIARMAPVVAALAGGGHVVSVVARYPGRLDVFDCLEVSRFQAPRPPPRTAPVIELPRNFAHLLCCNGYADQCELTRLYAGWRELYDTIAPDLIVFDHAPTAMLAARSLKAKKVVVGTGFCCLPDISPLPDLRPWMPDDCERLYRDEQVVLATMNEVLCVQGSTPLSRIGQLYGEVDATILATFAELDHYPGRNGARYYGVWATGDGEPPAWPAGSEKRIFAYLKPFPAFPLLLELLCYLDGSTVMYVDGVDRAMTEPYQSPRLRFLDQPAGIESAARQCDFAISNAGHGATAAMLLAGKPLLMIPRNLEQAMTARAVERLGAGLWAGRDQPDEIARKLDALLHSEQYAEAAKRFASQYADFNPQAALERAVACIETLLSEAS
jgi:hypothetical protein